MIASLHTAASLRREFRRSNTARQFGFHLVEAEIGRVVLQMEVKERHLQIHGVVHGGVLAALADTAGGLAVYLAAPRGSRAATVEMKINFLELIHRGTITADARVLRMGKRLAVVECDLHDNHKRMVGKALMTFSHGRLKSRSGS
jgi:uncharacterized protein (TIGR00369 family)